MNREQIATAVCDVFDDFEHLLQLAKDFIAVDDQDGTPSPHLYERARWLVSYIEGPAK